jgi:hypothetical protein
VVSFFFILSDPGTGPETAEQVPETLSGAASQKLNDSLSEALGILHDECLAASRTKTQP